MADKRTHRRAADRDQGPHYIPELDPQNKRWPINWHNRVFMISLVGAAIAGGGFGWAMSASASGLTILFGGAAVFFGVILALYIIGAIGG